MPQYFDSECIDKQTGRMFLLRLMGFDAEDARSVPAAWGFITSTPILTAPTVMQKSVSGRTRLRESTREPVSLVADLSRSGDLRQMLGVRDQDCHPVDRHFFLQSFAEAAYKLRNNRDDALHLCEWACWQWLMEAPVLIGAMRREFARPEFVQIKVPRRLVILLEKSGERERATDVAKTCQSIGLSAEDVNYLLGKAEKL